MSSRNCLTPKREKKKKKKRVAGLYAGSGSTRAAAAPAPEEILQDDLDRVEFEMETVKNAHVPFCPGSAPEAPEPPEIIDTDIPFGKSVRTWTPQENLNVDILFAQVDIPQDTDKLKDGVAQGRLEPRDLLHWCREIALTPIRLKPSQIAVAVDEAIDAGGDTCLKLKGFRAAIFAGPENSTLAAILAKGLQPKVLKAKDIPFGKVVRRWSKQDHANVEELFQQVDIPDSGDDCYTLNGVHMHERKIETADLVYWYEAPERRRSGHMDTSLKDMAAAIDDAIDAAGAMCLMLNGFKISIAMGLSKSRLALLLNAAMPN